MNDNGEGKKQVDGQADDEDEEREGYVLEGKHLRMFSIPQKPKLKAKLANQSTYKHIQDVVSIRKQWVWALGRAEGNIKNVDKVSVCSRHFSKDAYDQGLRLR